METSVVIRVNDEMVRNLNGELQLLEASDMGHALQAMRAIAMQLIVEHAGEWERE